MISKVYSIWFKFTRKFNDFRESWRSGLSSGSHAGGQRFEHVWGRLFFCKNTENAVKMNNSPHFTAFLTKIHSKIHRISYKKSPHQLLWQNNVRNVVKAVNAVKKNNSPHFTAFLTKIHRKWFPKFTQSDLNSQESSKIYVKVGAVD